MDNLDPRTFQFPTQEASLNLLGILRNDHEDCFFVDTNTL